MPSLAVGLFPRGGPRHISLGQCSRKFGIKVVVAALAARLVVHGGVEPARVRQRQVNVTRLGVIPCTDAEIGSIAASLALSNIVRHENLQSKCTGGIHQNRYL